MNNNFSPNKTSVRAFELSNISSIINVSSNDEFKDSIKITIEDPIELNILSPNKNKKFMKPSFPYGTSQSNINPLSIRTIDIEDENDIILVDEQQNMLENIDEVINFDELQNVSCVENKKERYIYNTNGNTILFTFCVLLAGFIYVIINRSIEYHNSKDWSLLVFIIYLPLTLLLSLSFFNYIIFGIKNILFNAKDCLENSKYYSCSKPQIPNALPQMTVQMPIYKESFENVIIPSIESIKKAVEYYNKKGGYCNIFINDDGYMTLSKEEKKIRKKYYEENNIAWIARPKENRKGRFKKGSNMNYAINFSKKYVENLLNATLENSNSALFKTLNEYNNECEAGGDTIFGDFVLLVDSDTIVPETCLYDTIGEFEDKKIVFTQHLTTPIEEKNPNFWDKTICHFTRMIYELAFIQVTAGGDPSPLVGHNAILRFEYLDEISYEEDGIKKYWNENTVCEDFDLSLRLQMKGYFGRYIAYTGKNFKEGVSPTYCDEIVRFKKYALGTAEITFNPFSQWCKKGIFSNTIKTYLKTECTPWYSKVLLCSYLCSYFIMAFTPLSLVFSTVKANFCNNCMVGDLYEIFLCIIIIYSCFLPLSTAIFKCKLHNYTKMQILNVFGQEYFHGFRMGLFFGSLGVHMMFSILTYLFNLDETFLSSRKEKPTWSKIKEFQYILQSYWKVFVFVLLFDLFYIINYNFYNDNKYILIPPTAFTFLHVAVPFFYS